MEDDQVCRRVHGVAECPEHLIDFECHFRMLLAKGEELLMNGCIDECSVQAIRDAAPEVQLLMV